MAAAIMELEQAYSAQRAKSKIIKKQRSIAGIGRNSETSRI